ncbi:haloacid dehalogenase type II [Bradyrhizobium sp.]|uniref:haloacid dehalogenase type II n=1 Tax=Bradyrhizobium sp. TaxID=376 RepID=UPI003C5F2878
MKLTNYKVLTFDCYGTLIDWETGIIAALQPLLAKAATRPSLAKAATPLATDLVLETFARHESAQEAETPQMIYSDLLAAVHRRLADEWGVTASDAEHRRFGESVPDWPAFADSATALAYLKQHYKLVILSNVDRNSFAGSNAKLGVRFDAIYTAQDIGSYKPDLANFRYMLDHLAELGVAKSDILHTAQSLFHDHAPARALGLASAWIDRRHASGGFGATMAPPEQANYDIRFTSLADLAAAHRAELAMS